MTRTNQPFPRKSTDPRRIRLRGSIGLVPPVIAASVLVACGNDVVQPGRMLATGGSSTEDTSSMAGSWTRAPIDDPPEQTELGDDKPRWTELPSATQPMGGAPNGSPSSSHEPDPTAGYSGMSGAGGTFSVDARLRFSEYIEGEGAEKALEISNLGSNIAVGSCAIAIYTNGNSEPYRTIGLEGDLDEGDALVVCGLKALPGFDECDVSTGSLVFNGDDAITLTCGDVLQDSIGQVGEDPGEAWGSEPDWMKDSAWVRRCHALPGGDNDPVDDFDPAEGWALAADASTHSLGVADCVAATPDGLGGAQSH